jgi:hypothetical protein
MLFTELIAVYLEYNIKHINTLLVQNSDFLNVSVDTLTDLYSGGTQFNSWSWYW